MPESVTDRCTKAHEYLFLLTKNAKYYYDNEAIREKAIRAGDIPGGGGKNTLHKSETQHHIPVANSRNRRSVWAIAPTPFPGAHFAVMPEALVEPCILAGSKAGDSILDPFAGSGTVGVVALKHHRNFVGVELNEEYADMARQRMGIVQPTLFEVPS